MTDHQNMSLSFDPPEPTYGERIGALGIDDAPDPQPEDGARALHFALTELDLRHRVQVADDGTVSVSGLDAASAYVLAQVVANPEGIALTGTAASRLAAALDNRIARRSAAAGLDPDPQPSAEKWVPEASGS